MERKFRKVNEVLLNLAEKLNELAERSVSVKTFWYWDYYKAVESDIKDAKEKRKIYQQIYHLERFGYFSKSGFSAKGLIRLFKVQEKEGDDVKEWDKKWKIVIFDIPEKRRNARNSFRASLGNLGFKLLQNSIWINPFADFDEIQDLVKKMKIEKYVILILADKISNNLLYEKKFGLN